MLAGRLYGLSSYEAQSHFLNIDDNVDDEGKKVS